MQLDGYVYEVGGVKLCLTEDQCVGSKYNGYAHFADGVYSCLTASQCREEELFTWEDDDSRKCVSSDKCGGYLYDDDTVKQCLKNCDAKPGYYMDPSRTCVLAATCTKRTSGARYLYQDDQGGSRMCVSVDSCKDYGYLY